MLVPIGILIITAVIGTIIMYKVKGIEASLIYVIYAVLIIIAWIFVGKP